MGIMGGWRILGWSMRGEFGFLGGRVGWCCIVKEDEEVIVKC
jgi:hypothetical protein